MTDPAVPIPALEPGHLDAAVAETAGLLVLDFWAPWCAPCRAMLTLLEEIAPEFVGQVTFAKFNVDDDAALSVARGIRGVPTLIFFRSGIEIDRLVGTESPGALRERIRRLLGTGD